MTTDNKAVCGGGEDPVSILKGISAFCWEQMNKATVFTDEGRAVLHVAGRIVQDVDFLLQEPAALASTSGAGPGTTAQHLRDALAPHASQDGTWFSFGLSDLEDVSKRLRAGAGAGDWATVPRRPLPEMLGAFWRIKNTGSTEPGEFGEDRSDVAAYRAMIEAAPAVPASPRLGAGEGEGDWRGDPSADERWNDGLDYGMTQFCAVLGVDPQKVTWDAATETVSGDVRAVICNILNAWAGDDWRDRPKEHLSSTAIAALREIKALQGEQKSDKYKKDRAHLIACRALGSFRTALSQGGGAGRSERAVEIRELSDLAYPGPWTDSDDGICGADHHHAEPWNGGDIICDAPAEGEDSRRHWPANRVFIRRLVNAYRSGELVHRSEIAGRSEKGEGEDGLGDGRRICEALGFDPINHHNALKCPYCNPNGWVLRPPAPAQSPNTSDAEG